MEELIEANPVAVYKALKDMVEPQNKKSPFIPCKQKAQIDYNFDEQEGKVNLARHYKKE